MSDSALHLSRLDLITLLERQILSGSMPPGAPLPSERQLAERFAISRNVVREALRSLAERRLIRIEVGRGAFVREPDPTAAASMLAISLRGRHVTARHVINARRLIEVDAARQSAEHHTDVDVVRIRDAVEALRPTDALLDQVRADLRFHLAIARASHNPLLEAIFGAMSSMAAELMLRSLSDHDVAREGIPQHAKILGAIENGNPTAAARHMNAHLDVALTMYGSDLDESLNVVAERRMHDAFGPDRSLDDLFSAALGGEVE